MKYMYDDKRTFKHLGTWAAEVRLLIATFFFWNSGTGMRMSQISLLQSILFQIVREHSALIPRIFPERWEAYNLFNYDHSKRTEPELRHASRLHANEVLSEANYASLPLV